MPRSLAIAETSLTSKNFLPSSGTA
jgi:hypothetical protein